MKSLNDQLKAVKDALVSVSEKTYHYEKPATVKAPYIVWGEQGEADSFHSNNTKSEQQIEGWIDYYTQTEFDANIDEIQEALNGICAWSLESVQYEDETKLIHYAWLFRVI